MASDNKKMNVNVVTVFGDCGDISSSMLIAGAYPARSDASGCAVSNGLAFSLWGSTNAIGLPVKAEGKQFYVRGIFEAVSYTHLLPNAIDAHHGAVFRKGGCQRIHFLTETLYMLGSKI